MSDSGVIHADLNAHNILLNLERSEVAIIDFDKARFAKQSVRPIARLRQSLDKLSHQGKLRYTEAEWRTLLSGYQAGGLSEDKTSK